MTAVSQIEFVRPQPEGFGLYVGTFEIWEDWHVCPTTCATLWWNLLNGSSLSLPLSPARNAMQPWLESTQR